MMKMSSILGTEATDLARVATDIGEALGAQPEMQVDDMCGVHYRFHGPGIDAALVHNLADPSRLRETDRYHLPEYKQYSIILILLHTLNSLDSTPVEQLAMTTLGTRMYPAE